MITSMAGDLLSPEERANQLAETRRVSAPAEAAEGSIRIGRRFANPQSEFPQFSEILALVQERFVTLTSNGTKKAAELKKEDAYFALTGESIKGHYQVQPVDMARLVDLLRAYQFGYGALEDYMRIPDIEEIYYNRWDQGFFIVAGEKRKIDQVVFKDNEDLVNFVRKIATENDVTINTKNPNVDATLSDGSRLNSTLEPLAVDGADFVIRRHRDIPFTVESLIERETMTAELAAEIGEWINTGLNIIVCGGTGSGKTSLLNTLGNTYIPRDDRLLIVENRKELQIETEDYKYFQTREEATKPNPETDISMRHMIKQTLRKRPDRIFIGEVRGGEAFDALTAWNSGEEGSMCTIHANSAWECISKLEQLCGFSDARPSENSVRSLISEAVDIVIHLSREKRGSRRRIMEVIQVLHPRKHDYLDPATAEWVAQLRASGHIQPQREGANDILIAPLWIRARDGELTKVMDRVKLRGRD